MNEERVEKSLESLAQSIPVNQKLKRSLYQKYLFKTYRKFGSLIVAGLLLIVLVPTLLWESSSVKAADLKIGQYLVVANLEPGTPHGVSDYHGVVYIPYPGEGIIKKEGNVQKTIYAGAVNWVKVSPSGQQLVFSEEGSLKVLELSSNRVTSLLTGDEKVLYLQPSWQTEDSLFYTRQEFSSGKVTSTIYSLNLETMESQEITAGSFPSYLKENNSLVYEFEEQIVLRDMQSGIETIMEQGNQPQASPDGRYIAYTKYSIERKELQKNIEQEVILQDVWIVSGSDFKDKNKITDNFVLKTIDEQAWLASLEPSAEVQVLSFSGRYSYFYPSWSDDSQELYFGRRDFQESQIPLAPQLIRVDFVNQPLAAQATVEQYLQAIINGNDDYATSLARQPFLEERLKQQRLSSYQVIDTGKEKNREYIDVQLSWEKEDGLLKNEILRFYLSKDEGHYWIEEAI
ncbi:MAG: hypothetical protein ACRKFN_09110 [Desulfitobacterium sp.]